MLSLRNVYAKNFVKRWLIIMYKKRYLRLSNNVNKNSFWSSGCKFFSVYGLAQQWDQT